MDMSILGGVRKSSKAIPLCVCQKYHIGLIQMINMDIWETKKCTVEEF